MDTNLYNTIEYDLNQICRSCLTQASDLISIFDVGEYYNSQPLNEIIMACAQVQVNINDGMPGKICMECISQVNSAYNFKTKCEQSDLTLRSYIFKKEEPNNKIIKNINVIKLEDDYNLPSIIKPEITMVEDDPLHSNYYEPQSIETTNVEDNDLIDEDDDGPNSIEGITEENINIADIDGLTEIKEDFDEENFNYKNSLNEQGRYSCHICEKTLADAKGLKLHIRLHTGKNLKRCSICNRGFAKQNHLTRHEETHKEKIYTCGQCNMQFPSSNELKLHMPIHKITKKKKIATMNEIYDMEITDDYKEISLLCKICDAIFSKISQLRSHIQLHLDSTTFNEIKLHDKLYLFDLTKITPNIENQETLVNCVINDIALNNLLRFYQITTSNGYELHLSDSESENDDNGELENLVKSMNHACGKCEHVFNRAYKLNRHIKFEHTDDYEFSYLCIDCGRKFATEWLLNRHIRRQCENKLKQYCCSLCKIKFVWQSSYELHNEKFHSGKKIKNEGTMMAGEPKKQRSVKEKPKDKNHSCVICNKSFYRVEHLDRHNKIHLPSEKKFECNTCQKKFNRKDNLRSHMRVHKDIKEDTDKHLCVYCGRSFSNSSNLIVHMRRHTGEKPYKCDLCDKGFPRSSDLQCHRRTHTGEKPCLCTICGKGFSRSNKLVRHMRIHTGVRPYKCTHCDRAFTQSNDLTLHIRRHTGEKPYVCGICGDRFIQGTALQTHRKMQGHYEEVNQPAPFASISVNNPNRYTNANRVNRIGILPQDSPSTTTENPEIKPIISRRSISTSSAEGGNSSMTSPITVTTNPIPQAIAMASPHQTNEINNASNHSIDTLQNTSGPHRVIPNIGIPGAFVPNGVPFLSNTGVLMQNLDVATTIFSISSYNNNFE